MFLDNTMHESHRSTPFDLMFWRSGRGPVKIVKELWTNKTGEEQDKDGYVYMLELRERIEEIILGAIAQKAISQGYAKSKK